MRKLPAGFTLVELLLASSLSLALSLALIQWHLQLTGHWHRHSDQQRQQQAFYQLAHWLIRDLQRQAFHPDQVQFDPATQCLRYGEHGVRLRQQRLQWRPPGAECTSPGWQALHAPEGFRLHHLQWHSEQATLCLVGHWRGAGPWHWCQAWYH